MLEFKIYVGCARPSRSGEISHWNLCDVDTHYTYNMPLYGSVWLCSRSVRVILSKAMGLIPSWQNPFENIVLLQKHLISIRNSTGGTFVGNRDIFDMIANRYDTSERVQIAKVSSDAMKEYFVNTKSKDGIDFGCGTGLVGMNLLNEFRSILFLDTSQNMLNIIEQKISDANALNASTLCFDFETSTQHSIRADYIFMAQVLLHIQDFESLLSKLYDILNLEGHLLIVDFNKNEQVVSDMVHNGFDQEQLKEIMSKIGYKDIRTKTFYTGSKLFMGQDASLFILDAKK